MPFSRHGSYRTTQPPACYRMSAVILLSFFNPSRAYESGRHWELQPVMPALRVIRLLIAIKEDV